MCERHAAQIVLGFSVKSHYRFQIEPPPPLLTLIKVGDAAQTGAARWFATVELRVTFPDLSSQGEFVACLLALLRQMSDGHYQKLLQAFSRDNLRVRASAALFSFPRPTFVLTPRVPALSQDFLLQIFTVFRILIRPEMFPKDWTVMRLVTNK